MFVSQVTDAFPKDVLVHLVSNDYPVTSLFKRRDSHDDQAFWKTQGALNV
jgi:hypothetical protein